ncbi:4 [Durusdinium trenchii]
MGAALRQGGHTARAMLEKGWRAVNRAYCAHFEDDARQAALQLLLGSHKLTKELSASNVVLLSSGDEARQSEFEAKASTALNETGETFVPVRSVGMVGLVVAAFVASRLASSIRSVSAQRIRSGLYGQAGNKGAVAVTFQVEETLTCSWGIRACAVAVRLHVICGGYPVTFAAKDEHLCCIGALGERSTSQEGSGRP